MFLSRDIELQICKIYTKININTILYKSSGLGLTDHIQQISNQSENDDIPEKANCKLGLLLYFLISIFNRFHS